MVQRREIAVAAAARASCCTLGLSVTFCVGDVDGLSNIPTLRKVEFGV